MSLGAARVIWKINDLSMFVDALPTGYVTMVLRTERGPVAEPRLVGGWEEYQRIFGKKVDWTTDPLVAEMALRQGARLNIIRAAHFADPADPTTITALQSSVTLKDRGSDDIPGYVDSAAGPFSFVQARAGEVTGTELGPFTFGAGTSDAFLVAVGAGADQPVTLSGSNVTTQAVADAINAATTDLTASDDGGYLKLVANDVTHNIEIKSVANDCYSVLGLSEGDNAAVVGTDSLVIDIAGEASQTFDLEPSASEIGTFELTAAQVVTQLAALTGGKALVVGGKVRIQTTATGGTATVQINASSTADTPMTFDNDVHAGQSGVASDTLLFESKDPGDWGNDLKVYIFKSTLNADDAFNVRITYSRQGNMTEDYTDLVMDPTSENYVVSYINERSALVQVTDLESPNAEPLNRPAEDYSGTALTGGDNGMDGFTDADWVGNAAAQTGIYAADKAKMSMDLMVPGSSSVTVAQALANYCEQDGRWIGYFQLPAGLEPEEAVKFRLGESPYSHPAFNSHRLCLYYGRPLVYDDMDDTRKHIPMLGHLAAALAATDNFYGQHFAPAGPKRGQVTFVEGIDFNVGDYRSAAYADLFAEHGINYLMIDHSRGTEGVYIWEQRTSQRVASALREINVIRFITVMNMVLKPMLWQFLFDPNHPVTWREVHRVLEPALQDWKDRYAIYDFILQTDRNAYFDGGELKNAVINTGLDIDRGIYHCRALIQPTRAIYYLEFELGVLRTGEAFEKYTELKHLPGWVRR